LFNEPPRSESYTPSLHDALPICALQRAQRQQRDQPRLVTAGDPSAHPVEREREGECESDHAAKQTVRPFPEIDELVIAQRHPGGDRKSTRLKSSHVKISYAVFCL